MVWVRRLPSLNGVKAFEAAARTGGFAAISRLVRLLEQRLGTDLFARHANRLALTAAGEPYRVGLTPLLDGLAGLTEQVVAMGQRNVVTIGVGPTFAIRWLIPRLADLQRREPELEVRIATGRRRCARRRSCVSRMRPTIGRTGSRRGGRPIRIGGPEFAYDGQALQAAIDGLGVAMGIRPYIDDGIAAERLIAPFAVTAPKGAAGISCTVRHVRQNRASPPSDAGSFKRPMAGRRHRLDPPPQRC